MKKIIILLLIFFSTEKLIAQDTIPKIVGFVMNGNSGKPILDVFIVDSTQKNRFKLDDGHTVILYADENLLNILYSSFRFEKRYDSTSPKLLKSDYVFGTFIFYFQLQNENEIAVRASPIQSTRLFQKMLCHLSSNNKTEAAIIKEIDERLSRIGAKIR